MHLLEKRPYALISGFAAVLAIASILFWSVKRDRLPRAIRIAAGASHGLYFEFADQLGSRLEKDAGRPVHPITTRGSVENFSRLTSSNRAESVEVAIIQGGSVTDPSELISAVAPLFVEVVHVVARRDRGINQVRDLEGKAVTLGEAGSGMRASAELLLNHYNLEELADHPASGLYFTNLLSDTTLDAAIVTSGFTNSDLQSLLRTGQFTLIPITHSRAIENIDLFFRHLEIPAGQYGARPDLPEKPIPTLATVAFLAVRSEATEPLVDLLLRTVYKGGLRYAFPSLIQRSDAAEWELSPLHPVARRYFFPQDELGRMANIMESLAAVKELLFATILVGYLIWERLRRYRRKHLEKRLEAQKEYLDRFLEQTLAVERAQIHSTDLQELRSYLEQITRIKLTALQEFTDEELRGDQAFSIFLMQCSSLIHSIRLKIIEIGADRERERERDRGDVPDD